jgi:hypothetical protein
MRERPDAIRPLCAWEREKERERERVGVIDQYMSPRGFSFRVSLMLQRSEFLSHT